MDRSSPDPSALAPERVLAAISVDGVVTLEAAFAAGLSRRVVERRVARGSLIRVAPGVFRLPGAPLAGRTAMRAALAATGSRGLGLWSANALHGVTGGKVPDRVHVLVDRKTTVQRTAWYVPHTTRRLDDDELTIREGLPGATMSRTVRDMAAILPWRSWADELIEQVVEEALMLNRLSLPQLQAAADRERARPLRRRLQRLVEAQLGEDPALFKSVGEAWLRDLVAKRGLPMPAFNVYVPAAGGEVDAYWADVLIVEFDGFKFHRTRRKHDKDRRRDRRAWRNGIPTVRITKTDFLEDRPQLERDLERFVMHPRATTST